MKRIAVMTSGGDAPGMNPCLRAVVRTAAHHKIEVYGIKRGFAGLLNGEMIPLGPRDVSRIIQKGGTVLQTARAPEFLQLKTQRLGVRRLNEHAIDGLIVIGGEGSLNGALALHRLGVPVVGVPASIDNDIWGTNMAIGVDTALNTILEAIDKLRDTASSLSRAFVVETMGRDCGYLALMAGVCGGAENVVIPERDCAPAEIAETIEQAYLRGKTHVIIVIAEGARYKSGDVVKYLEEHESSFDVRVTILGHIQRGGRPTAFDRLLATRMGVGAVQRLLAGDVGIMVGLSGREIANVPLEQVTSRQREANLEYYELVRMLAQ